MQEFDKMPQSGTGGEGKIEMLIESDMETRKGRFAKFVMARTDGDVTTLDFIYPDLPGDESRAVLQARVMMGNSDIMSLRDMLVAHTEGWVQTDGE